MKFGNYIRTACVAIKSEHSRRNLRKEILMECREDSDPEKRCVGRYLRWHRLRVFPYPFARRYRFRDISVFRDEDGYPYVIHRGSKLFLRKDMSDTYCQEYYNSLRREQDRESAHCYLTREERYPVKSAVVADIGAAEGIFALDLFINMAEKGADQLPEKMYLFECDPNWEIPLRKTLSHWMDRCEVIPMFIGDRVDDSTTTLDAFFEDKKLDYVKADIEGAEESMLQGGRRTLIEKVRQVLLCAYHLPDAEQMIRRYLEEYGFSYEINPGYMIFLGSEKGRIPPYLRHGVIYGHREAG